MKAKVQPADSRLKRHPYEIQREHVHQDVEDPVVQEA